MSLISLEPSTPIVLDPKELRRIAKAALGDQSGSGVLETIKKENLEVYIASMEKDVKEYASCGYFDVSWNFADIGVPSHQVHEIADEFVKRHVGLMVYIIDTPTVLKIRVSWGAQAK